jgi:TPR repeat protein
MGPIMSGICPPSTGSPCRPEGVARDHAEAVRWYRKAADGGNSLAAKALKRLLRTS